MARIMIAEDNQGTNKAICEYIPRETALAVALFVALRSKAVIRLPNMSMEKGFVI